MLRVLHPIAASSELPRPPVYITSLVLAFITTVGLALTASSLADEPAPSTEQPADEEGIRFFESKIRPVLVRHCYSCHSAESGEAAGGLVLDSRQGIRRGGSRGPAVVPGKPEQSLLLAVVEHREGEPHMPPDQPQLPAGVRTDLKAWIARGAPDPRDGVAPTVARQGIDWEKAREFWAYQRPVDHRPPKVSNPAWAKQPLDHFILARLEAAGLTPSPDARPATLLRRLHFDLVGLPPSPLALRLFLQQVNQQGLDAALAAEVDRLLASPRFGERWGRHWLDVARFAESSGKETNVTFPHAWRYRNWVIDAFNQDKPYDRFLTEQIAGDLLPYDSPQQRADQLIATGFLAVGPKGLNENNKLQFLADVIDEQIDALTQAVMASTVACARCHDHKFDPFSMEDYYALAGIFASSKTCYGTSVAPGNQVGGDLIVLPNLPDQVIPNRSIPKQQVEEYRRELAEFARREEEGRKLLRQLIAEGKDPTEVISLADILRAIWRKGAIEGILKTVDDEGRALPLAMGVVDADRIADVPLLQRGELSRPGEIVPRGFPRVMPLDGIPPIPSDQSGRLQLALWLTHPDHPLTARVMVNRVWSHLFGEGIVRTVDNFGAGGERPSHPELLDHLAVKFVKEHGWSVKALIKELVLSRTYRQSSAWRQDAFEIDPDNRLLWRASKRRLDAEAIRDAMLAVSGQLDVSRPRSSLVAEIGDRPVSIITLDRRVPPDLDGSRHRSVYLPVLRDKLPDVLELFDFAEPSLVTGNRETTNVPLQALYLMNSPFVMERAAALAERVTKHSNDRDRQIRFAFVLCFSRLPMAEELQLARQFFAQAAETDDAAAADALKLFCHSLLATAEFRNLD